MDVPVLTIRRGRRQDFEAVMHLLGSSTPAGADRRTLRRFRHIVADLGADLYVAEIAGRVVGVVHASYARRLGGPQRARVEDLAAAPDLLGHGIERRLLEFILERARRRSCASVCCVPASRDGGNVAESVGLSPRDVEYCRSLDEA